MDYKWAYWFSNSSNYRKKKLQFISTWRQQPVARNYWRQWKIKSETDSKISLPHWNQLHQLREWSLIEASSEGITVHNQCLTNSIMMSIAWELGPCFFLFTCNEFAPENILPQKNACYYKWHQPSSTMSGEAVHLAMVEEWQWNWQSTTANKSQGLDKEAKVIKVTLFITLLMNFTY